MAGNIPYEKVIIDFFGWLNVHRLGREHLFHKIREKYDWGYINACKTVEAVLKRLLEEHMGDSDRIDGDKGILEQEVP